MSRRTITTEVTEEDKRIEGSLRPQTLDEYIGQERIKSTLKVFIHAAKSRGEALDHVLFYGPPGLGKTTLSGIIANEMGTRMKVTSGPAIEKPGEIAAILNGLQEGDVLFVDEIHRLNRQVEEVLYPAMEDYAIDIMLGKDSTARSIRLDLPKFTLVGATTRAGLLTAPLRDRFGIVQKMDFYTPEELQTIVLRTAGVLNVEIDKTGAYEIARRSRGTPRLANRLLKRVRDFAQVKYNGVITKEVADFALDILDVDKLGLDNNDRAILHMIIDKFSGGPVGLETLAAALGGTFQYFGWFTLVCFALQGGFAALLCGLFAEGLAAPLAGSLVFAASPILLERAFRHTSLGAQWLVLAALYCYFVCRRQSRFASRGLFVINILAVGIHPYFLPMTYAVTLALLLEYAVKQRQWLRPALFLGGNMLCTAALGWALGLLYGTATSGGQALYGYFAMNLNALWNPAGVNGVLYSRLLPAQNQVGGNYDAFAYLGLGVLAALPVVVVSARRHILPAVRRHWALCAVCAVLTAFAVSNVITANGVTLATLPLPASFIKLFSVFRSGGRLFWPVYYLLTLAAIAKEIRQRGLPPECSVRIAAGLPLTSFGRDKPKFKDYLLRSNQPVNFKFEGVEYSITIEEVAVFPQGYAALMTEVGLLQDEPSMLLMDLGGWTVDLMRIDNAIPAADTAHSLELGMIRCVDDIREQVRRETGLSLTDAQIENMLAGQPCTVSEAVRDIVNQQGRKYTEHLLSATMEAGFDLHAIPAVLLGGGASVVSRHLGPKDGLCKTIFLLDDKVNAVGFERALTAVSHRKSEA